MKLLRIQLIALRKKLERKVLAGKALSICVCHNVRHEFIFFADIILEGIWRWRGCEGEGKPHLPFGKKRKIFAFLIHLFWRIISAKRKQTDDKQQQKIHNFVIVWFITSPGFFSRLFTLPHSLTFQNIHKNAASVFLIDYFFSIWNVFLRSSKSISLESYF